MSAQSSVDWNNYKSVHSYCNDPKWMQRTSKIGHRLGVRQTALEWSCDGKYLVSTANHHEAYLYAVDSSKSMKDAAPQITMVHRRNGKAIRFGVASADWHPSCCSKLVTAAEDQNVYLWDLERSNQFKSEKSSSSKSSARSLSPYHIITTDSALKDISWSHDGSRLCILDRDSKLTMVDVGSLKQCAVGNVKAESKEKELRDFECFEWSKDDRFIVAATRSGTVCCFDARTLRKEHEFEVHNGSCSTMDISGDCKWIATGGSDSMINVFDLNHLIQQYAFTAGDSEVNKVAFDRHSKLIASCSDDPVLKIGYIGTEVVVQKVVEIKTQSAVHVMKWHPTRDLLAYSGIPDLKEDRHLNLSLNHGARGRSVGHNVNIWGNLKRH